MIFRKLKLSLLYKGKEWDSNYEERHFKFLYYFGSKRKVLPVENKVIEKRSKNK